VARIALVRGDITKQEADAIVNAANGSLMGGGGVNGAIHHAAGSQLLTECRAIPQVSPGVRCPTGEARITRGYRLPAKFVIHTVGPIWDGGDQHEDELLANCYRNSLALATQLQIQSIAFPAISTGIYGFPLDRATRIAVREVRAFGEMHVTFCCFGADALRAYHAELGTG
jgi:O-acetyl-ADP-ribose deacetylase (regulator of RNase III)